MGRREDGAAVGDGPEIRPRPAGSAPPGNPAAGRCGAVGSEQRTPRLSGDGGAPLPGITTRRQELADRRGWSTYRKRGPRIAERRQWSAGRRLSSGQKRGDAFAQRPTGWFAATHRGSRTPPRLPALRSPLWEPRIGSRDEGSPGADIKNTGDESCLRGKRLHQLRSFPRKREPSADLQLGPRFRGGERKETGRFRRRMTTAHTARHFPGTPSEHSSAARSQCARSAAAS